MTTPITMGSHTVYASGFDQMFRGCTSLTRTPTMTIAGLSGNYNCSYMFYGCSNLTTATGATLSVASLTQYTYQYMFANCTHLTGVPTINATTLNNYCMRYMFQNCSSLVESPILKGTALKNYCYEGMFSGCTSLNKITSYFTTAPSNTYTKDWVKGVPTVTTGQYIRRGTYTTRGTNAIPTNWVISNAP